MYFVHTDEARLCQEFQVHRVRLSHGLRHEPHRPSPGTAQVSTLRLQDGPHATLEGAFSETQEGKTPLLSTL